MTPSSGWILLDKPSHLSSRAAGARIGRLVGQKTFGHLGTLDPMASGLLPIAYGHATKVIPFMPTHFPKEYLFSVQFGVQTDTLDALGQVVRYSDVIPSEECLRAALAQFIGDIPQVPPIYSAVHVDGHRAYDLARRGTSVDIPPRPIHIDALDLIGGHGDKWDFRVRCSGGTYVRAIARDLAAACGTVGTTTLIRRTETNGFSIKNAVTLDFLENLVHNGGNACDYLHAPDFGLGDIPVINLGDKAADLYYHGGFIPMTHPNALVRVYCGNRFIGIGQVTENCLRPKRTF